MGAGQSRFNDRVALRRQLRQVGFQNIRILDRAYLVQARAPDGQPVVMILSPSGQGGMTTSSVGTNRPPGMQSGMQDGMQEGMRGQMQERQRRGQQFGANRNATPGLEALLDRRELSSPMVNPGLVEPGQAREYLRMRGFSNVSNLRRDGVFYTATADWNGEQVNIRLDARNGLIVEPNRYLQSELRRLGPQGQQGQP
ncbi:hypothetical protein [Microvirga roseola]|uniref:hypothetical protein n=1 Tax=Microvirga roseola TaxID=2883126 RepID=UPI001E47C805|nr:hypothetical protein [Microvirga roseola]